MTSKDLNPIQLEWGMAIRWWGRAAMAVLLLVAARVAAQPQRATLDQDTPAIVEAARQIVLHAGDARLIVLGERHGTREIPALAAQLMAHYATEGPVMLALEVPHAEQAALDRHMASDGGMAAWQALADTPFWHVADDQHDGRRSVQMRQLVDAMRVLRTGGATVNVLAYDVSESEAVAHDHHWRDVRMADTLRAAFERMPGTMLVLTGNVHAMRVRAPWAPAELQREPMTRRLLDLAPLSVNLTAASGQFWGCVSPGACRPIDAVSWSGGPDVRRDEAADRVYDLWLRLPAISVADLVEPAD